MDKVDFSNDPARARVAALPNVSRETLARLDAYASLLVEWNQKFNLVSKSTIPALWARHIEDSVQLFSYLPTKPIVLADMGSGAGFPGMVLALMSGFETHLIESIGKKATFLREVAAQTGAKVTVHQERIEAVTGLRADIVTARALTALPALCDYAKPLMKKDSFALFLKGKNLDQELTEAKKKGKFSFEILPSQTGSDGCIVRMRLK